MSWILLELICEVKSSTYILFPTVRKTWNQLCRYPRWKAKRTTGPTGFCTNTKYKVLTVKIPLGLIIKSVCRLDWQAFLSLSVRPWAPARGWVKRCTTYSDSSCRTAGTSRPTGRPSSLAKSTPRPVPATTKSSASTSGSTRRGCTSWIWRQRYQIWRKALWA